MCFHGQKCSLVFLFALNVAHAKIWFEPDGLFEVNRYLHPFLHD